MKTLLIVFIISLHALFGQSACPNSCSDNGWCQGDVCTCESGYFEKDCSKNIVENYGTQLIIIQAFLGSVFFLIAVLCVTALYHALVRRVSSVAVVNNIQFIVFGSYLIVSITHTIYTAIDPLRVWGIMNLMSGVLLFCTIFPFSVFAFISVLFHWIDLIHISVTTLRKEEMLQKISINYKPKDITLEDMVEKLKFLGKLKIPFAVLIVMKFVIIYATQIIGALIRKERIMMFNVMIIVASIYYVVISVGFLIYRKRLISLMPVQLTKKVRKLTDRVTFLSIFILVAVVVLAIVTLFVPRDDPQGYLAMWTITQLTIAFVSLVNVSIFLNWKKKFPFVVFSTQSTKNSSHGQPTSLEAEELVEVSPTK